MDNRIAVNLKHQFFAAQAVYPDMKAAGGGAIVNFIQRVDDRNRDSAIYSTAKAGVLGLTNSLARDLGVHNIRVNAVVPGWIMTQRQIDLWLTPEGEANLMEAPMPQAQALSGRLRADGLVPGIGRRLGPDEPEFYCGWRQTLDRPSHPLQASFA